MRVQFAGRSKPGVGLNLELQLVDPSTFAPLPAANVLLEGLNDPVHFQPVLFQSALAVETSIHDTVAEVERELHGYLQRLLEIASDHRIAILASGTHPVAGWRDLHITESPRYEAFIRRLQWVGRRAAVFGLRIHVGMPNGEKAIAVGNSVATLLPLFVALSASSPFWRGHDTGLASCRTRVLENFPNAGLPPNLLNFGEFQNYLQTLRSAEAIESLSDIWWDVRPNMRRGTLEFQVCDTPHTPREALALAGLAQALSVWILERYEGGDDVPHADSWIIRENKWRAARFGLDAELVESSDGQVTRVEPYFERLRLNLAPVVNRLTLEPYLQTLDGLFQQGPGYFRQRQLQIRFGLEAVAQSLVQEFHDDLMSGA